MESSVKVAISEIDKLIDGQKECPECDYKKGLIKGLKISKSILTGEYFKPKKVENEARI